MKHKITINDVAKKAGVSVTTVSLVLNNKQKKFSEKTIHAIHAAIKELGFIKNQNAAFLREKKSNLIGLIAHQHANGFYEALLNEIEQEIFLQDKLSFVCHLAHESEITKKISSMIGMGCDHFILCLGDSFLESVCALLNENQCHFILIVQSELIQYEAPTLIYDNYQSCKNIMIQLIQQGHRKIAYLGGAIDSLTRAERLRGYIEALMEFGLSFNSKWILSVEALKSELDFEQFITQNGSVSAFLCHDQTLAIPFYAAATKLGRSFQQSEVQNYFESTIKVIGFNGSHALFSAYFNIEWINAPFKEMAQKAVRLLECPSTKERIFF